MPPGFSSRRTRPETWESSPSASETASSGPKSARSLGSRLANSAAEAVEEKTASKAARGDREANAILLDLDNQPAAVLISVKEAKDQAQREDRGSALEDRLEFAVNGLRHRRSAPLH